MTRLVKGTTSMLAVALALAGAASAAEREPEAADALVVNNTGFLGAHPDLRWRREGMAAIQDGRQLALVGTGALNSREYRHDGPLTRELDRR